MKVMNFTEAYRMLGDMWKLYRKYAARNLTEAETEDFAREAQSVYENYKTPFAKDVVLAVIGEIDRTLRFFGRGVKE